MSLDTHCNKQGTDKEEVALGRERRLVLARIVRWSEGDHGQYPYPRVEGTANRLVGEVGWRNKYQSDR